MITSSGETYRILGREQMAEGDLLLKISLDPSDRYRIVLRFTPAVIESIDDTYPLERTTIETILLKNKGFILNMLVKQALRDPHVIDHLQKRLNGFFTIDHHQWLMLKTQVAEQQEQAHHDQLNDILIKAHL